MAQQRHLPRHPHKNHEKTLRTLDRCMYIIGLVGPVMTLPQVFDAYNKHIQGLSLPTWFAYTIVSFLWFCYGAIHKEKPIIIANFLYFVFDASIVLAILFYR